MSCIRISFPKKGEKTTGIREANARDKKAKWAKKGGYKP